MVKPTPKELVDAAGISQAYASMILSGDPPPKGRTPPRPLAIRILRETGWKHPSIADLTDKQIAVLEEVEPWRPPSDRQEEAA